MWIKLWIMCKTYLFSEIYFPWEIFIVNFSVFIAMHFAAPDGT